MLRQSIYSARSTVTTKHSKISFTNEKVTRELDQKPLKAWIQKILPFLKSKSIVTLSSEDDQTIEEVSPPTVDSESVRNLHIQEFLATENQYLSELLINYEKIDSHLSVLSFLAGGMQFQSFDLELIKDLSKVSKYFISGIENNTFLEYTEEIASIHGRLVQFATQIQKKFNHFLKQFPGSESAIVFQIN